MALCYSTYPCSHTSVRVPRMAPLVQLAIAQLKPRKGDYRGNLARLAAVFREVDALEPRPALLCFAETALTGYFLEGGVREVAVTAGELARDLDRVYREAVGDARPLDVSIGFYELWENRLYNSALYVTLGTGAPAIRHVHRKVFLPTYGLFDEERFVERGLDIRAFDTSWGRAAMLVCEDVWHSLSATIAALDGAQVLIVPTAPPARGLWPGDVAGVPASVHRWERLAREIADEHGIYVVLANLVGSEGSKMFPGGSAVVGPRGNVLARGPLWEEAIATTALDLVEVTRARTDLPLLADLEVMLPHLRGNLDRARRAGQAPVVAWDAAPEDSRPARTPRVALEARDTGDTAGRIRVVSGSVDGPLPPVPLEIDAALTEQWLVHFIREEVGRRGFRKAIVGLSGGVDSAVTACLAARAIGPENVIGVRMPHRTSSPESLDHARLVAQACGIQELTVDISAAVDGYLALDPDASPGRRGNVMARMRMIVLFDLSAKHDAIPLGTGNKTERLFGYFTWHADDTPPINPIGDLFKTQVWALARHLGLPDVVVTKAPTADLVAGQTDEGDFGISYDRADEILNWMLNGYGADELVGRGMDAAEVALVRRRLESTHWKRRLPTVAMVSPTAIGESYLRPVDY